MRIQTTMRFEEEFLRRLTEAAAKDNRTRTNLVVHVVTLFLDGKLVEVEKAAS